MNAMVQQYRDGSRPIYCYCAIRGFVDEGGAVRGAPPLPRGLAGSAWQNPASICPQHQMLLPRLICSQIVRGLERPKKGA